MTKITKTGLTEDQFANVTAIQDAQIARQTQGGITPTTTSQTSLDSVMKALQDKILGEGGVVSSEDTGFEKAIAGLKGAGEATEQRIESQWGREIDYATGQANVQRTQALEGRRGFATQKVALKLLEESNIKYIGDLQTRKEEALLANDAATAQQVAGLQVQAMQYEQQEKQNYFTNLLSVGNMAMGVMQMQQQIMNDARTSSQFDWQKQMDQSQLDFRQSQFDYQKIHNKTIINQQEIANKFREQEMRLKYGDDPTKVQPNEGFISVDWQMEAINIATPFMDQLSQGLEQGIIEEEDYQDELDRIFKIVRKNLPIDAVSDDALLKLLDVEPEFEEESQGWWSRVTGGSLPGEVPYGAEQYEKDINYGVTVNYDSPFSKSIDYSGYKIKKND